mgnify:CR=1 FL=1
MTSRCGAAPGLGAVVPAVGVGVAPPRFEHRLGGGPPAGGGAVHDAGHLQPEELASDDAVLHEHLEVGVDEVLGQLGRADRLGDGPGRGRFDLDERRAVHLPHRGSGLEERGPPGQHRGVVLDEQVHVRGPLAISPHEGRAEPRQRPLVDQHPGGVSGNERRATREVPKLALAGSERGRDEARDLGPEQGGAVSHG